MSEATAIANDLNGVVRDWLAGHRPEEVPEEVAYRSAQDTAPVERPFFVVGCENVQPEASGIMVRGELVLRMRTRADEQEASEAALWHAASVRALRQPETFQELQAAMQGLGYWLRPPWVAGDYEDEKDGKWGRVYVQRWRWCVQTELP